MVFGSIYAPVVILTNHFHQSKWPSGSSGLCLSKSHVKLKLSPIYWWLVLWANVFPWATVDFPPKPLIMLCSNVNKAFYGPITCKVRTESPPRNVNVTLFSLGLKTIYYSHGPWNPLEGALGIPWKEPSAQAQCPGHGCSSSSLSLEQFALPVIILPLLTRHLDESSEKLTFTTSSS